MVSGYRFIEPTYSDLYLLTIHYMGCKLAQQQKKKINNTKCINIHLLFPSS